jgi:catechol 2,3-dioxygenase-like lactoylglutathione lyase family enzyme
VELGRAILFVKRLEPMVSFYGDTLGLTLLKDGSSQSWAEFAAEGARLALHAIPAELAETIVVADPPRPREETPIKLVFWVDDVAAERTRLLSRGVVMLELRAWGACDGVDPEGNVFQIAQR